VCGFCACNLFETSLFSSAFLQFCFYDFCMTCSLLFPQRLRLCLCICLDFRFCYLEFILFFPCVIAWILAFVIWNLSCFAFWSLLGTWFLLFGIYFVFPFGHCLDFGFCYLEFNPRHLVLGSSTKHECYGKIFKRCR
jgi:hypothetical protein